MGGGNLKCGQQRDLPVGDAGHELSTTCSRGAKGVQLVSCDFDATRLSSIASNQTKCRVRAEPFFDDPIEFSTRRLARSRALNIGAFEADGWLFIHL